MSQYVKDILERIVATFVVAFLGALAVAAPDGGLSVDIAQAAALAGIAAVLSLVKGLIATKVGDSGTASLTV